MGPFCEIHVYDQHSKSVIVDFLGTDEVRLAHIEQLRTLYREQRQLQRQAARRASVDRVSRNVAQWLSYVLMDIENIGHTIKDFQYVRVI